MFCIIKIWDWLFVVLYDEISRVFYLLFIKNVDFYGVYIDFFWIVVSFYRWLYRYIKFEYNLLYGFFFGYWIYI